MACCSTHRGGGMMMMGDAPIIWMNINPVTQKNLNMLLQIINLLMRCTPMANVFYKGKIKTGAA